jgi:hypothetical protein
MNPGNPKISRRAPLAKRRAKVAARDAAPPRAASLGAFRGECDDAVAAIKSAVRELCGCVGVDPLKPQEVGRRLGLNKNLTWKFARILLEEDALDAVPMLPRPEGLGIFLRAFAAAGAPDGALDRLRGAIAAFDAMVSRHFGGRADLELVLDGLRTGANLEQSRRLAFRGAAAVFGVQAAARVTAQILTPSRHDESTADIALIVGLAGLRRLRPIPKLPVFRSVMTSKSALPPARPLMHGSDADAAEFLIREFSSFPHAGVTRTEVDGKLTIELDGGPIGRIGEADLFFGSVSERAYSRAGSAEDPFAQFITSISIPSESFLADMFVHRSIQEADAAEAAMFGALTGPIPHDPEAREPARIPIECTPAVVDGLSRESLARMLDVAAVPHYAALVERSFAALGEDPRDYRLIRVAMAHPPMPASLVVRWPLPT